MTERQTGFLPMKKRKQEKQANPLAQGVVSLLLAYKKTVYTSTPNNGTELAGHEHIAAKLNGNCYFAHPYSARERGLNEYTNKLIRQYVIS